MLLKALKLSEELGYKEGIANACSNLGNIHQARGDLDRAEVMQRRALQLCEELGDKPGTSTANNNLSNIRRARVNFGRVSEMKLKAPQLGQELGRETATQGGEKSPPLSSQQPAGRPYVFISHCNADKPKIGFILDALLAKDLAVWIDRPDELGLSGHPRVQGLGSGPFRKGIKEALQGSACVLVIWSISAADPSRTELLEEASYGKSKNILVQATLEPRETILPRLPFGFAEWHLFETLPQVQASTTVVVDAIKDVISRNPLTGSPPAARPQASRAAYMAVKDSQLIIRPRLPGPAPTSTFSNLEELRCDLISCIKTIRMRLKNTNSCYEQDISNICNKVLKYFDIPLTDINLDLAPAVGMQILTWGDCMSQQHYARELSNHIPPKFLEAVTIYKELSMKWGAWTDRMRDPAISSVTPENAYLTREAADKILEFTKTSSLVDESVQSFLAALRRLVKDSALFSSRNEYLYLNAIGEGLRACWDEGRAYIDANWASITQAADKGDPPSLGAFNTFILEMQLPLLELAKANPALFDWLVMRIGYLQQVQKGEI